MKITGKIILSIIIIGTILAGMLVAFYLKGLPYIISKPEVIEYVQNAVKKYTKADLIINKPQLHTEFSTNIEFKVEKIYLSKNNKKLLELNKFNSAISVKNILKKNIIVKKLVAESIFADVNAIQNILPQSNDTKKSEWSFDIFDALLGVRNCEILYAFNKDTNVRLLGQHIGVNNAQKIKRNVYFQLFAEIHRKDKYTTISLKDNQKVFFENKHFYIKNCPLNINKSSIFIDLAADKKQNFDINLSSDNFKLGDILDFLNTQIIENNISETLAYFSDIKGDLNFKLNIQKGKLNGNFDINNIKFGIKSINNIPITITQGNIKLTTNEIKLSKFEGYYDTNKKNKIDFEGTVKDYLKSIDTDITGNAIVRNDFLKKYLTKISGTDFEIKGEAPTRIMLKSKNNIMDFVWLFMLKPGQNIKIAGNYLPFENSLRFMKSDMHLEKMVLDIKSLDYHMVPADQILTKEEIDKKRAAGEKFYPIFKLKSSVDIANNNFVKFIGFEIPKPLPSEILNAVLHQEVFKKGEISGHMFYDNRSRYPFLKGSMNMDRVLIPIQKLFIKKASLDANNHLVHINADGGYRRSKFNFNGDILNEIKFPMIIKNVNLSVENIDTIKLLGGFNNQAQADNEVVTDEGVVSVDNSQQGFDIRNVIIEKGKFHLDNGEYKDIKFSNLDADLTLDKNGIINIKSNKFSFAGGYSSLLSKFDLINKKYNVKLGVKDVDSDILANALLDLRREITGKASGFLDLTTDDTMKLSGIIKFIIKDGTIEKIGLVEYVLKCASIFRNTLTMINPGTIADIINVPEGNFDKITGDLTLNKNIVTGIKIKTYSPTISNYIAGRYNIDNGDTSLRIYTKLSNAKKGFTGMLRRISLNSLANRIPFNSKNDANYYAVELSELPEIDANEKDSQIFLTRVEGDVVKNNYISSLKKIK